MSRENTVSPSCSYFHFFASGAHTYPIENQFEFKYGKGVVAHLALTINPPLSGSGHSLSCGPRAVLPPTPTPTPTDFVL